MKDDFSLDEFENKEQTEVNNKEKFYNVLWFAPGVNIFLFLFEKQNIPKSGERFFHLGMTLFIIYFVLFILLGIIISFKLSFFITLLYFLSIWWLALKAYNNIYIEIDFLENLMKNFIKKDEQKSKNNEKPHDPLG